MCSTPKSNLLVWITTGCLLVSSTSAAIWNVPADFGTIQACINAASDGDECVVAPGTYLESIDFLGKAITVRSSGGAEATTIDGAGALHVIRCVNGETTATKLRGFTVTGGAAHGGTSDEQRGGGVYVVGSALTIEDCLFRDNSAFGFGGSVYVADGELFLMSSTFTNNTAAFGGAVALEDSLATGGLSATISDCTFDGNTGSSAGGGIFHSGGILALSRCLFSNNRATGQDSRGGGVQNTGGQLLLSECRFVENEAVYGGGIYSGGGANDATFVNSVFISNSSVFHGGAVYYVGDALTLEACEFFGNSAGNRGGAVFIADGSVSNAVNCIFSGNVGNGGAWAMLGVNHDSSITNCTLVGNIGRAINADLGGSPTVTNTILWANEPIDFTAASVSYSLTEWAGELTLLGNGNIIGGDPLFVDPDGADDIIGTEDDDLRLQNLSPAIDAGNNSAPLLEGITTDIDGNDRFVNGPIAARGIGVQPIVDMGAYENQTVSNVLDPPFVSGEDLCYFANNFGGVCSIDSECMGVCGLKNRYLTIGVPPSTGDPLTLQVRVSSAPFDPAREGEVWWAGSSEVVPDGGGSDVMAPLLCELDPSHAEQWPQGILYIFGPPVVPEAEYEVRFCDVSGDGCSDPLRVGTRKWGDVVSPFGFASQPNFGDINAIVAKFQGLATAPILPRVDLVGSGAAGLPDIPNQTINFADINANVSAFQGQAYPFVVAACP